MRTTVNLDTDAYDFAYAYARGRGITLGVAISELLRRAEQAPAIPAGKSGRLVMSKHGYFVIAGRGEVITSEMVKELAEDPPIPNKYLKGKRPTRGGRWP